MTTKICKICNEEIKAKDNYLRLTDYHLGKFFMEGFYHTPCFNKQIKGVNPQQKVAMKMLDKAHQLLNRMGVEEPKKVYDLQ